MSKRKKEHEEELNYWQSISDVMAALLLIVLLLMMLFILYMARMPDADYVDEDYTSNLEQNVDGWNENDPVDDHLLYWIHDAGSDDHNGLDSNNGDDHGNGGGDDYGDYPYKEYGEGDYEGDQKAAVYVTVRDGETGLSIKSAGITFKLIHSRKGEITLFTYYPNHERFDTFKTMASGSFYLPEKIGFGSYRFNEISVPYGYDASADVAFTIEESHDWDSPYAVAIDLFPCRNVIRVQNIDKITGEKVPGGTYVVYAAADIITADGTLRYSDGQQVDEIVCDENGYGVSRELYLGQYVVRQAEMPEYYAATLPDLDVYLERKEQDTAHLTHDLLLDRTALNIAVQDELYTNQQIADAGFVLSEQNDINAFSELTADAQGRLFIGSLKKDTTYVLQQTATAVDYQLPSEAITFTVAADGLIDGSPVVEKVITNRKIRIAIGLRDRLLGNEISNKSLAVYDEQGQLIRIWTTSAVPEEIDGLNPGKYRLVLSGRMDQPIELVIEDVKEVQNFTWHIWTTESIIVMTIGSCAAIALIVCIVVFIRRYKLRKKK